MAPGASAGRPPASALRRKRRSNRSCRTPFSVTPLSSALPSCSACLHGRSSAGVQSVHRGSVTESCMVALLAQMTLTGFIRRGKGLPEGAELPAGPPHIFASGSWAKQRSTTVHVSPRIFG